jgi:hypothetical protein
MTPEELEAYNSGKKVYRFTGEAYTKFYTTKKDPATGKPIMDPETGKPKRFPLKTPKVIKKQIESTKMYEATDARTLSSGQLMEEVYAAHANKLKALGNLARKAERNTPNLLYNPSAKITYAPEIDSLMGKLHLALMNPPLERQAQLIANKRIATIKEDNPGMSAGDLKKLTGRCLTDARDRVGAKKKIIKIEEREWEAIQAGAITHNNLMKILRNADLDVVKQMAMPRTPKGISEAKISKANVYLDKGYTPAQVATMLGISTSVLNKALGKKDKE